MTQTTARIFIAAAFVAPAFAAETQPPSETEALALDDLKTR